MQFENLFSPIKIGTRTAKNRILFPAHLCLPFQTDLDDGSAYIAYQAARAKGGCGLTIVGLCGVHPSTLRKEGTGTTGIFIPKMRRMAEAVHEYGTLILLQLWHHGSIVGKYENRANWSFSEIPIDNDLDRHEVPHEMTDSEINEVIDGFATHAKMAQEAGMDGIEIHGAHGYLVQQSWSRWANQRTDRWGEPLAFITEIINRIRVAVGKDFILGIRMTADDLYPDPKGNDIVRSKEIAQALESTGKVDLLNISVGHGGRSNAYPISNMYIPPASISVPLASGIKQVIKSIPVVAVGRINDPAIAEKAIADGHCDMVGLVRGQIADPEFCNKAREGRVEDIRLCIGCNQGCPDHVTGALNCTQNTVAGRENTEIGVIRPSSLKKHVMVIGGGPGGMEAARVAALRGHYVTLFEKENQLGGQINILSKAPGREEFSQVTRYLSLQLPKSGVTIKLNTNVTPELVKQEQPDVVIVATGSCPYIKSVAGIETARVVSPWQVLNRQVDIGGKALVYDCTGYQEGPTVADFLGEKGLKVELVTSQITILASPVENLDILGTDNPIVWQRLRNNGVNITPHSKIKQISGRSVTIFDKWSGEESVFEDIDTVVMATGYLPNNSLYKDLKGQVNELYMVGDCVTPRRASDAIHSGYTTAFYI